MIRTGFRALPGPLAVRVLIAAVIVAVALVALHYFYDWLGRTVLDPGGGIG